MIKLSEKYLNRLDYWKMVADGSEEGSGTRAVALRMVEKYSIKRAAALQREREEKEIRGDAESDSNARTEEERLSAERELLNAEPADMPVCEIPRAEPKAVRWRDSQEENVDDQIKQRRAVMLSQVSPFCVKDDWLVDMMTIAADGVDFATARKRVKGLDPSTYHCLMVLGGHQDADSPQNQFEIEERRRTQKHAVYALIEAGATFDEMCSETMLGRETVGHYVAKYAQEKGVDREELPCVIDLKRRAAERAKMNAMKQRIKMQERRKIHAPRALLRRARIRKGLTGEETGKLLGITKEHYSKIERGEQRIGEAYIQMLHELLGIDRNEILEQVQMSADEYAEYLSSLRLPR